MEAGIPVVLSDFPIWREILNHYKCGISINPDNKEEIIDAINMLLDNPQLAKEMGENGRKAVEEKYNWRTEEKKLLNIYNTLLGGV